MKESILFILFFVGGLINESIRTGSGELFLLAVIGSFIVCKD